MKGSILKKSKKNFMFIFFAMIFCVAFVSCKKKPEQNETTLVPLEFVSEKNLASDSMPVWHHSFKKICIVFGYGYNEKNYVQGIVESLAKKYGLDDGTPDSGLIFPLVFPDDFPGEKITRLPSIIGERELAGLVIVGAPERTNFAIASLEDEWDTRENMIPYPVYAFFPQDDIAGIEATCNFVLDRTLEGSGSIDNETDREEVAQTQVVDLDALLNRAVEYMFLTEHPLPPDENLIAHVSRIVGKDYKVSRYIDAQSGLQSVNHFLIEEK
ncbi:MAG: hypothetical protein K2N58_03300 [Treponemataceae bacterium]|nr:hypothetical protein [Treponemataceae bacterium]